MVASNLFGGDARLQTWAYEWSSSWGSEDCQTDDDDDHDGYASCADPQCEGEACPTGVCLLGVCQPQ